MSVTSSDDVFIDAPAAEIHRALLQTGPASSWWPRARIKASSKGVAVKARISRVRPRTAFRFEVGAVRPEEGLVWRIDGRELTGTAEWWLEPYREGAVLHVFISAERAGARRAGTALRRTRWAMRRAMNGLKDHLEREVSLRSN